MVISPGQSSAGIGVENCWQKSPKVVDGNAEWEAGEVHDLIRRILGQECSGQQFAERKKTQPLVQK